MTLLILGSVWVAGCTAKESVPRDHGEGGWHKTALQCPVPVDRASVEKCLTAEPSLTGNTGAASESILEDSIVVKGTSVKVLRWNRVAVDANGAVYRLTFLG